MSKKRLLFGLVAFALITAAVQFVANLAANQVSSETNKWPGPLELVHQHPLLASAATIVLLAVLAGASWWFIESRADDPSGPTGVISSLDQAAETLAATLRDQWQQEEQLRLIDRPSPLPVRYTNASEALIDQWRNICRSDGHASPIQLDGNIDTMVEVFQRVPSRRLVVLGKAGAGKTVLTVRFMLSLLPADNEALDSRRVPVLFSLTTWNPASMSLTGWLEQELVAAHPSLGKRLPSGQSLARQLLFKDRILLVLDGLDELASGLRTEALKALSESLRRTDQVLLTSRLPEYRAAVTQVGPLADAAVVTINDLEVADLQAYLPATRGTAASGSEWVPVLDQLPDAAPGTSAAALRDTLRTPLMVYLARIVYQNPSTDPNQLLEFSDSDRVQVHLLDGFVPAAYDPGPGKRGTARMERRIRRTKRHLAFLATHLIHLGTPNFRWWQLPQGLSPRARLRLALGVGLLVVAVIGLIEAPVAGSTSLLSGLGLGMVLGSLVGLSIHKLTVLGREVSPVPARIRNWRSWGRPQVVDRTTAGAGRLALRFGLLTGLVTGLLFAAATPLDGGASGWLEIAAVFLQVAVATLLANAAAVWVAVRLARRLEEPVDLSQVLSPEELLRADRSTAQLEAFLCGLAAAAFGSALYQMAFFTEIALLDEIESGNWNEVGLIFFQEIGIPAIEAWVTVLFLLIFMLTAWGRFTLARIYFALTGQLPLRLMAFLRDAHSRGVLRQSGSVYQFRHLKLRDRLPHAADLSTDAGNSPESATSGPTAVSPLSG